MDCFLCLLLYFFLSPKELVFLLVFITFMRIFIYVMISSQNQGLYLFSI